MGCGGSNINRNTVPIGNSLYHLIQTSQNSEIIKRIQDNPKLMLFKINNRGDRITHYACAKNNLELVKSLRQLKADFNIKNDFNQTALDQTKDEKILKLFGIEISKFSEKRKQEPKLVKIETFVHNQDRQKNYEKTYQVEQQIINQKADESTKVQLKQGILKNPQEKEAKKLREYQQLEEKVQSKPVLSGRQQANNQNTKNDETYNSKIIDDQKNRHQMARRIKDEIKMQNSSRDYIQIEPESVLTEPDGNKKKVRKAKKSFLTNQILGNLEDQNF